MTYAIGFGSTETDREKAEEQAIRDYAVDAYEEHAHDYITDNFVEAVRAGIAERASALRAAVASYKNAEDHPDRYGYYTHTVIADASNIVVILRWIHTNRRHAFSPDGWACILVEQVFVIHKWEDLDRQREAA